MRRLPVAFGDKDAVKLTCGGIILRRFRRGVPRGLWAAEAAALCDPNSSWQVQLMPEPRRRG